MQATKQQALDAIATLPDDADLDEIMYRLYVLDKVNKGRQDAANDKLTSTEDLRREIDRW
ncbi:MAG: hypothetical protein AAF184_10225 [Pseudomonadota bacterium]